MDASQNLAPQETPLWKASPSQLTHAGYYFVCVVIGGAFLALAFFGHFHKSLHDQLHSVHIHSWMLGLLAVIPFIFAMVRYWLTTTLVYELSDQRIKITKGIVNRHTADLELYRIKDYTLDENRMMGLGNITLLTSDTATPNITIRAIGQANAKFEVLRRAVEGARDRKRVRSMDIDSPHDGSQGMDDGGIHHT